MSTADASSVRRRLQQQVSRLGAALRRIGRVRLGAWIALVVACVSSRLATTITYVEDPDSLRFALSVANGFDLAALQPHFPGYPVFWAVAELLYLPTGHFSASFSVVGGLATAGLVGALLAGRSLPLRSVGGFAIATAVVANPLIWLMGNRYMPDLLGTACVWAAFVALLRALSAETSGEKGAEGETAAVVGIALTGLLAGLRLSYLPLVLVPALMVLMRSAAPMRLVLVGGASTAVWLVPMIVDTGLRTLVDVAWSQTTGHFTEFGGTVQTESDLSRRLAGFVRGLWADGLGAWWPGRHPLTAVVGAGVLGLSGLGVGRMRREGLGTRRVLWLAGLSLGLYALWVFFFQNVIHKSRHILPLLPVLLVLLAAGGTALWQRGPWARALLLAVVGAYAAVTAVLVSQHQQPTAIAQAKTFVAEQVTQEPATRVASIPLVHTYLRHQQVDASFVSVNDSSAVRQLRRADTGQTLVVGTYPTLFDRPPDRVRRFTHNPYVNRMWPVVTVSVYEH